MSTTVPQHTTAPHQALYRRWRAQTFSEIVGQGPVVETLRNAVRVDRVSHAILFVGPRGTGKTSLARILAKALNCTDLRDGDPCDACPSCVAIREGRALDLIEIDAASNRGIDAIRDLRERINYAPTDLRRKVYILDEAHQITRDAWNALLKSLEEPPDFVAFMFASTQPQDFPAAILSRLQRYDVRRLTVAEIEGKLARILEAESIAADPAAVRLIARLAEGGMRDAESMLDQLLASAGGRIDEAAVRDLLGLAEAETVDRLVAALVAGDVAAGIAVLDDLEDRGRNVGSVLDQVIEAIRADLSGALRPGADPARVPGLARVARRLAEIDPERRGVGGLRLQVELALFAGADAAPTVTASARAAPELAGPAVTSPDPAPRIKSTPTAEPAPEAVAEPDTLAPSASRPGASASEPQGPTGGPTDDSTAPPQRRARPQSPRPPTRDSTAAKDPSPATHPAPGAAVLRTPAPTSEGLDQLRAGWPDIVAKVSEQPAAKPLILACRPISFEANVVTLGFPEGQAFLKDALERRRSMIEDGIGAILGRAVAVRCVATNLDLVPPLPTDEEASQLLAEARRIFEGNLLDIGEVS